MKLRIAIKILFWLLTTNTFADITIEGETVHVETDNYKVQFDHGSITHIHNKLTNETYTVPHKHNRPAAIIGRYKSFWVGGSTAIDIQKVSDHNVEILYTKNGNQIRITLAIEPTTHDLLIGGDCIATSPGVIEIQWGISNLDIANLKLLVPSEKRQLLMPQTV